MRTRRHGCADADFGLHQAARAENFMKLMSKEQLDSLTNVSCRYAMNGDEWAVACTQGNASSRIRLRVAVALLMTVHWLISIPTPFC